MRLGRVGTLAGLWVLFLAVECGAQIGLKLGSGPLATLDFGMTWVTVALESPWVQVGIACYVLAFVLWMLILDKMELSLAFPLSPLHWAGVALIVSGVCVLGRD
jgi:multidrug transporter EmrE-like cation transporter